MNEPFKLLGARLRVASLERSAAFYSGVLGLHATPGVRSGEQNFSPDFEGQPLLTLVETPGAVPAAGDAAGLFHLALLVPNRAALARVLLRLSERRAVLQGLSDHRVSEAIYLADPDGNGLEIYADRPKSGGAGSGAVDMTTQTLDIPDLLSAAPDRRPSGLPPGTRLGHVHLRVTDLNEAERFYTEKLPLVVSTRNYPGALFFAADGYHHHVAANTWGVRRSQPKEAHAGLEAVLAAVPGLKASAVISDADGNRFELAAA